MYQSVAAAKACSLLLFVKQEGKNGKEARFREVRNIPFPEEGKDRPCLVYDVKRSV